MSYTTKNYRTYFFLPSTPVTKAPLLQSQPWFSLNGVAAPDCHLGPSIFHIFFSQPSDQLFKGEAGFAACIVSYCPPKRPLGHAFL